MITTFPGKAVARSKRNATNKLIFNLLRGLHLYSHGASSGLARSAWQPLSYIHLELPCGCSPGLGSGRSWWQLVAEVLRWHIQLCLYRIVPVGYRVQIRDEEYRMTWGQRLMAQLGQALTSAALTVALGCSQLAGWRGSELCQQSRSPLRRTGVGRPLPGWALGTLHMGHLQMRSQRGRSCGRQSCGVGLPHTHSVPWPTRQHSQLPKSSWLEEEGPFLTCHKVMRPARPPVAGTLQASEPWHQVKLRHSTATDARDHGRTLPRTARLTGSGTQ